MRRNREERRVRETKTTAAERVAKHRAEIAARVAKGKPWHGVVGAPTAEELHKHCNLTEVAKTQKARGVGLLEYALRSNCNNWYGGARQQGYSYIHVDNAGGYSYLNNRIGTWPLTVEHITFPKFARPCPKSPRHGFVESRPIKSPEELQALRAEVLAADPEGEILLGPAFEAVRASFVATPVGVTWGKSNDGATSNTSATLFIPSPGSREDMLIVVTNGHDNEYMPALADAIVPNTPYIEGVVTYRAGLGSETVLVQLRDGPEQPQASHFIPRDVFWGVTLTPKEGEDLLAWERRILDVKEKDQLVVWLPGGALASHYAVHAIASGITVYTGPTSREQTWLTVKEFGKSPRFEYDARAAVARRISELFKRPLWQNQLGYNRLVSAVSTIQSYGTWDGKHEHLQELLANALVDLFRYAAAACLGEARYFRSKGPGGKPLFAASEWASGMTGFVDDEDYDVHGTDRDYIYKRALGGKLNPLMRALAMAQLDFALPWGRSAFGGRKWADCAKAAIKLGQCLRMVGQDADSFGGGRTWLGNAVSAANDLINQEHNGGCIFNKWGLHANHLTAISQWPGCGFMNAFCGDIVLRTTLDNYREHGVTFDSRVL